jgi:hypothetical protein
LLSITNIEIALANTERGLSVFARAILKSKRSLSIFRRGLLVFQRVLVKFEIALSEFARGLSLYERPLIMFEMALINSVRIAETPLSAYVFFIECVKT